mmetsp:Transcript_75837/g.146593  ORF Transcript_75837/g.146593 Transcript_75837/m.146593 type:complete len:95 (-) Transcript_75837:1855-2139(-)
MRHHAHHAHKSWNPGKALYLKILVHVQGQMHISVRQNSAHDSAVADPVGFGLGPPLLAACAAQTTLRMYMQGVLKAAEKVYLQHRSYTGRSHHN